MARTRFFACLSLALLLAGGLHAQVGEKLELQPGVTCLEVERVAERIDFWLAGFPVRSDFRIEVRGSRHDPRSIEVVLHDDAGNLTRRSFAPGPERCADLHDAAGLSAALLIKAASGVEVEPAEPGDPAAPAPRRTLGAPPPVARDTPAVKLELPSKGPTEGAAERHVGRTERLGAMVDVGPGLRLSSELAFVFRTQFSWRFSPSWMLETGFAAQVSGSHALGEHDGSYRTRFLGGSAFVCVELGGADAWGADWCAGGWAGRLLAMGASFVDSRRPALRAISVSTGPRMTWQAAPRVRLLLSALLVVPVQPIDIASVDARGQPLADDRLRPIGAALTFGLSYALVSAPRQKKPAATQGFPRWAHE